jgi:hypothetical protein
MRLRYYSRFSGMPHNSDIRRAFEYRRSEQSTARGFIAADLNCAGQWRQWAFDLPECIPQVREAIGAARSRRIALGSVLPK